MLGDDDLLSQRLRRRRSDIGGFHHRIDRAKAQRDQEWDDRSAALPTADGLRELERRLAVLSDRTNFTSSFVMDRVVADSTACAPGPVMTVRIANAA